MNRVAKITGHMTTGAASMQAEPTSSAMGIVGTKSPDDVVIVSALRTAIGRARKGGFKDTTPDTLLGAVLKAVLDQSGVKGEVLGDIAVGNVQLGGAYAGPARMAMLSAGLPKEVPLYAVNRQCSSGLQAVANIASAIRSGQIDAGIGAGVESMTAGGGVTKGAKAAPPPVDLNAIMGNKLARDCMVPMGVTSENVAARFGVTREQQDQMAVISHERALQAQANGWFDGEIVPVKTQVKDEKGDAHDVTISKDEGPRAGTTMESLSKLKTVFKKVDGTTTAGTSSQVSDGAAAVLLMRRSKALEIGAPIIGVFRGFQVVGCEPDVMGIGPAVAIPAVLKATGLTIDDVDVFEVNEAFASQAVYCCTKLGLDMNKVNPHGGAIALGHPLGCTGARQIATLMNYMKRTNKKVGVVSMCIGTGMGAAAVFEKE
jgi:acetyl-CoA acyltransferase 1